MANVLPADLFDSRAEEIGGLMVADSEVHSASPAHGHRLAKPAWSLTLFFLIFLLLFCLVQKAAFAQASEAAIGLIRVDRTHVINSFDPDSALGSSLDVLSRTDINRVFTPHVIEEALSAGWGPITYRNNTELRMGAW